MGRRSFDVSSTLEADKREFHAQGQPMAKDSSGSGRKRFSARPSAYSAPRLTLTAPWLANPCLTRRAGATGTTSASQGMGQPAVESRFFFTGTVTATDMSRATDTREGYRVGFLGSSYSYKRSSGRVTAESIGRDLNPLGRGDGMAYLAGAVRSGWLAPALPYSEALSGSGSSVNNSGGYGIGGEGHLWAGTGCTRCCTGYYLCVHGVNSAGPAPDPCPLPCTWEECKAHPEACHYRDCARIGCGCGASGCRIISGSGDNCVLFKQCGCEKFGSCKSSTGFCTPGKFIPNAGGPGGTGGGPGGTSGGPGGTGGGPGCTTCGGGGGSIAFRNPGSPATYSGGLPPITDRTTCNRYAHDGQYKLAKRLIDRYYNRNSNDCDCLLDKRALDAIFSCLYKVSSKDISTFACANYSDGGCGACNTDSKPCAVTIDFGDGKYHIYLCCINGCNYNGTAAQVTPECEMAASWAHELVHICGGAEGITDDELDGGIEQQIVEWVRCWCKS